MAWHLHTVRQRLILTTFVRRHVYTSPEICCLARTALIPSYQCCQHRYKAAACLYHQVSHLHTTHCLICHGIQPHSKPPAGSLWPWDVETSKKEPRHQIGNEEFQALKNSQHKCTGNLIPVSKIENSLMCVYPKNATCIRKDDDISNNKIDSHVQTKVSEQMDSPLVFHVDAKGRQKMLDLLEEDKQSSGLSALNELNRLADIIQKQALDIRNNSKQYTKDYPTPNIGYKKQTAPYSQTSDVYQNYLKSVKQTSIFEDERKSRMMTMRAVNRHKELQMVLCSSAASDNHLKLSSDASTPSSGGGQPSKEQLVIMYHRLFEQIPNFYSQSHDYTMYSNNVVFDNRILNVKTRGMPAYKATIQSLKYLSTACLWNVNLEVLNLMVNTEMNCIQARWRVTGVPLHRLILFPWSKGAKKYFDAFSTFEVGSDGLIHTHIVDKVMPNPGDKLPSIATRLAMALGIVRRPPAVQGNCASPVNLPFLKPKWLCSKIAE